MTTNDVNDARADNPDGQHCAQCYFFGRPKGAPADAHGVCRAHPPQVLLVPVPAPARALQDPRGPAQPTLAFQSQFPPMAPTGWCGEWEPADGEDEGEPAEIPDNETAVKAA